MVGKSVNLELLVIYPMSGSQTYPSTLTKPETAQGRTQPAPALPSQAVIVSWGAQATLARRPDATARNSGLLRASGDRLFAFRFLNACIQHPGADTARSGPDNRRLLHRGGCDPERDDCCHGVRLPSSPRPRSSYLVEGGNDSNHWAGGAAADVSAPCHVWSAPGASTSLVRMGTAHRPGRVVGGKPATVVMLRGPFRTLDAVPADLRSAALSDGIADALQLTLAGGVVAIVVLVVCTAFFSLRPPAPEPDLDDADLGEALSPKR